MKMRPPFIFVLLILILSSFESHAQEDTTATLINQEVKIITHDGKEFVGILLKDDGREILINTRSIGRLYIDKTDLKSMKPFKPQEEDTEEPQTNENTVEKIDSAKTTKKDSTQQVDQTDNQSTETTKEKKEEEDEEEFYHYKNYHSTKYIINDNALPLRRGEAFMKFTFVGFEGQLPITKNWSAGVMASYLGAPSIIKTKYSFPKRDRSCFSLDLMYGSFAFSTFTNVEGIRTGAGALSGTLTIGDRLKNFSLKGGYGLVHKLNITQFDWNWQNGDQIITQSHMEYHHLGFVMVGGLVQLNSKSTFVFDGGIVSVNDDFFVVTAGAASRFGPSPHHQFQLGGTFIVSSEFPIPIPILNFSYTYVFKGRNP